jgi:tetratricopeptide (TPR) repeat protein
MLVLLTLARAVCLAAPEPEARPVEYSAAQPKAVAMVADSSSDSAFASDLQSAEEFLRRISREKKMDLPQYNKYKAAEIEKARQFYRWSVAEVVPHARTLAKKLRAPDELIAEGRRMVEADPASWKGYDFIAMGSLVKNDVQAAKESFERALGAAPGFQKDWYRYMLAGCQNILKDTDAALELYDGILSRNENWVAVKSAYITSSLILLGRDNDKAALNFDRGMSLHNADEKKALLGTGVCDKFKAVRKTPESCAAAG